MIPNGIIMCGDIETAKINNEIVEPINFDLMPIYIQRTSDVRGWLESRAIDSHRTNSRLLKKALRLTNSHDIDVVLRVHAATITDNYWFKEAGTELLYDGIRFKDNIFDKLALYGDPDSFNQKSDSTPELTNIGSYEKCWRLCDGQWWLYKQGNDNERFSELFISLLGKRLGFNMAHYELEDGYIKSIDYTNNASVNYEPMSSFVGDDEDYQTSFNILHEISWEAAQDFVNMIYLDTICFNMDRHTKNYGILRNFRTGEVTGLAPNFDNNIALISRGYPKNIERSSDKLIELFCEFIENNEEAYDMYSKIDTDSITKSLINELIGHTGFDVDREHICKFILNGCKLIQKRITKEIIEPNNSEYHFDTGMPLDETHYECGLPEYLRVSLNNMKKSWEVVDSGKTDNRWDIYWCELNADINSAEVENIISSEQAWYLRSKYLRMKKEDNV